jgi:hypothetical protein
MVLTGILRHYATLLMQSSPKKPSALQHREQASLARAIGLRNYFWVLSREAFEARKQYLVQAFKDGEFLKDRENRGKPQPNPMTDPAGMESMMGAMKSQVAMIVPQTLIMGWINAFFSGFVVLKLPFPLTIRFKGMLQSGVQTRDLDVRWVSSLSWYFLNLFGLQAVFGFILGQDNAASQIAQQMGAMNPAAGVGAMFAPGQDPDKLFSAEAENLEVVEHWSVLDGVEERLLTKLREKEPVDVVAKKRQ